MRFVYCTWEYRDGEQGACAHGMGEDSQDELPVCSCVYATYGCGDLPSSCRATYPRTSSHTCYKALLLAAGTLGLRHVQYARIDPSCMGGHPHRAELEVASAGRPSVGGTIVLTCRLSGSR